MIENELKYVLNLGAATDEIWFDKQRVERMYQGYLGKEGARIRRIGGWKNVFTYKIDTPDGVEEFEINMNEDSWQRCWPIATNKLMKDRYTVPYDGDEWVVDRFLRPDYSVYFCMAEVEMKEGKQRPVNIPDFVSEYLVYSVPRSEGARWSSKVVSNISEATRMLEVMLDAAP